MKKLLTIICVLALTFVISACQSTDNKSIKVFGEKIVGDSKAYSVKGVSWGSSAEDVQSAFPSEKLKAQGDRLISEAILLDNVESVKIYMFTDENRSSLCSAEVAFRCKTNAAYTKLIEKLYCEAIDFMPNQCMQGDLKGIKFKNNISWEAADKSYVYFVPSEQQLAAAIRVTMPHDNKK